MARLSRQKQKKTNRTDNGLLIKQGLKILLTLQVDHFVKFFFFLKDGNMNDWTRAAVDVFVCI